MDRSISATAGRPCATTAVILSFLDGIGLQADVCVLTGATSLPGISIEKGLLRIDPEKMLHPGDLLHEAGHLAVVPAAERAGLDCDSIARRPDRAAEEMMAMAWSYAAAVHLGIDPRIVFHADGYKGGSESILASLQDSQCPMGVPMLHYHGLCRYGAEAAQAGVPAYPVMLRWVLD